MMKIRSNTIVACSSLDAPGCPPNKPHIDSEARSIDTTRRACIYDHTNGPIVWPILSGSLRSGAGPNKVLFSNCIL
ncbi:unnamed protein product [Cylindrotheca closterium]|uniref:Uncharacterized protein n=1 Tax=Cylindrotheca closterium TaxID=2856 RepID=A0AAD2CUN2_9STRA|nr:unnamed protein product [Cylindrotheca closterium]